MTLVPRIDYSHIIDQWGTLFENAARGDLLTERDIFNDQIALNTGDWQGVLYTTALSEQRGGRSCA